MSWPPEAGQRRSRRHPLLCRAFYVASREHTRALALAQQALHQLSISQILHLLSLPVWAPHPGRRLLSATPVLPWEPPSAGQGVAASWGFHKVCPAPREGQGARQLTLWTFDTLSSDLVLVVSAACRQQGVRSKEIGSLSAAVPAGVKRKG